MTVNSIESKRVSASRDVLIHPQSPFWTRLSPSQVTLLPTPLGRQPSEYLKYTQDPQKVGKTKDVDVRTAHNGEDIFFMLRWDDDNYNAVSTEEISFVDGVGVIIPFKKEAPHTIMVTMGSEAFKVNVWYWRADEPEKPRNVWAAGLGTTVTSKKSYLFSKCLWTGKQWNVVIGRKMHLPEQVEESVQLSPGMKTLVSFGVWEGSNKERGGIKSFCPCEMSFIIGA